MVRHLETILPTSASRVACVKSRGWAQAAPRSAPVGMIHKMQKSVDLGWILIVDQSVVNGGEVHGSAGFNLPAEVPKTGRRVKPVAITHHLKRIVGDDWTRPRRLRPTSIRWTFSFSWVVDGNAACKAQNTDGCAGQHSRGHQKGAVSRLSFARLEI